MIKQALKKLIRLSIIDQKELSNKYGIRLNPLRKRNELQEEIKSKLQLHEILYLINDIDFLAKEVQE